MTRQEQLEALCTSQHERLSLQHDSLVGELTQAVHANGLTVDAIMDALAGATRMLASAKEAAQAAREANAVTQRNA